MGTGTWKKDNRYNNSSKVVLFLINPLLGFFYSLRSMNTRTSYVIIFCTFLLFGLSFTVDSAIYIEDTAGYLDGMSHRADFEYYRNLSWREFSVLLKDTFKGDGERDYYAPVMKFLISRVTYNYHVFFLGISFVFSFFCMKSLCFFVKDSNYDNSWTAFALAYLFLSIQIFQINGVRFYTAAWVTIFSLFKLYVDKDKKFLLLLLLTPLIHRAYIFFLLIMVCAYFFKKYEKFWVVLFFLSFFFSEFATALFAKNISILPESLSSWAQYYIEAEVKYGDGGSFFDLFDLLVRLYRNILIFLLIKNSKKIKGNTNTKNIYEFLLVLAVFVNLTMPISNLGLRFAMLTCPLIAYVWLLNLKGRYNWIIYTMPIVYFYKAFYYDPLMYMKVLEPCFFYSSPIYLVFKYLL